MPKPNSKTQEWENYGDRTYSKEELNAAVEAALADVKRKERLEEAEWWARHAMPSQIAGHGYLTDDCQQRLDKLRAAAQPTAAKGGRWVPK
jgi:hypothetical protein